MIDASVWVSYFVVSDPRYQVANEWVNQQLAEEVILAGPGLVLAEVAGAVARISGDPVTGREALGLLRDPVGLGLEIVTWEPHEEEEAARIAADLRLWGSDAHYVLAARRLSMPLISWDEEQLARAGALVPVGRPGEPVRRPEAGR